MSDSRLPNSIPPSSATICLYLVSFKHEEKDHSSDHMRSWLSDYTGKTLPWAEFIAFSHQLPSAASFFVHLHVVDLTYQESRVSYFYSSLISSIAPKTETVSP